MRPVYPLRPGVERFIGSGDNLVSIFHSMSIHINSPSQSVSLPGTPGYWRGRSGWSTSSPAVGLRWDPCVPGSTELMGHGQECEAG